MAATFKILFTLSGFYTHQSLFNPHTTFRPIKSGAMVPLKVPLFFYCFKCTIDFKPLAFPDITFFTVFHHLLTTKKWFKDNVYLVTVHTAYKYAASIYILYITHMYFRVILLYLNMFATHYVCTYIEAYCRRIYRANKHTSQYKFIQL